MAEVVPDSKSRNPQQFLAHSNWSAEADIGQVAATKKVLDFVWPWDRMGERFVVDLHSDFTAYIDDPAPYIPEKRNKRGRPFTRYRTDAKSYEVKMDARFAHINSYPSLRCLIESSLPEPDPLGNMLNLHHP